MPHPVTAARKGPWQLLVLDRSEPADPRWLIATITGPADVRPASAADTAPGEMIAAWAGGALTQLPRTTVWLIA
jgi:hypothetical protein